MTPDPPLAGLRILDLSTVLAGPMASALLADFGAEVVKVELPGVGDPLRQLAPHKDGVALWWKVTNRNKAGVTLDIRKPEGAALFRRMLPRFDVLVENFRPGTLDRYGFDQAALESIRPGLVVLRVSGYGQTGPLAHRPGFAKIAEAFAGFTYICGDEDGPPMHTGYPIADAVTGLFGVVGVLVALLAKARTGDPGGEQVDVSLVESTLRMLEFLVIEHDQLGRSRARSGNRSQYAGPSNVYATRDRRWVALSASTQRVFERLAVLIGRPELATSAEFGTNPARVENAAALDAIVAEWFSRHDLDEVMRLLDEGDVTGGPVHSAADLSDHEHLAAREAIVTVPDAELGEVRMQGVVPRLVNHPGAVRRAGPMLGEDNERFYLEELGLDAEELAALRERGVV